MNEISKCAVMVCVSLLGAACSPPPEAVEEEAFIEEGNVSEDATPSESSREIGPMRGLVASTGPAIQSFTVDGYTPTSYYLNNPATGPAIYTTIPQSAQVVIRWSFTNATCSLNFANVTLGQGASTLRIATNLPAAGSYTTTALTTDRTYVLQCVGPAQNVGGWTMQGQIISKSIHIQPAAAPAPTPACSYTYGAWGACVGGSRTRTVVGATPATCAGTPVTNEACTVPLSVELVANASSSTRCPRYSTFAMSWTATPGATCVATTSNWSTANGNPQKIVFTGSGPTTYGIRCTLGGATVSDSVVVSPQ